MGIIEDLAAIKSMALEAMEERTKLLAVNAVLVAALGPIAKAYPDDPGTSDLDNEQPVRITLGDVRRVWRALAAAKGAL